MKMVLSVSLPGNVPAGPELFAKSTWRNKNDVVKESMRLYL